MSGPGKIPVAVLGATGVVGQKLLVALRRHPWFELAAVAASRRSVGRRYGDAVRWLEPVPLEDAVARLPVMPVEPGLDGRLVLSALDTETAAIAEPAFAAAGYAVVSNAAALRMEDDVPLVVPEVNAGQLALLEAQRARGWAGPLVTNPNCSAIMLALALYPIHRAFGVERVIATTMQALSGAGYPGVASLDAVGNVIPYIPGEEEKIERELGKILDGDLPVSVQANRVPVPDGHLASVSVALAAPATPAEAARAWTDFLPPEDVRGLPSAPCPPIVVHRADDRPQPRLDAMAGHGMQVSVGRVRPCPVLDLRFTVLGHNTIRGAAGAALLNAELLVARGMVARSP